MWKCDKLWIDKAILKKNRVRTPKLPDFKTYYKPNEIRECNIGKKIEKQIDGALLKSSEVDSYTAN